MKQRNFSTRKPHRKAFLNTFHANVICAYNSSNHKLFFRNCSFHKKVIDNAKVFIHFNSSKCKDQAILGILLCHKASANFN